ncbi:MAG TPA: hypothetical protein VGC76_18515 [Pyrinomonadaceae bacterium]|jgi:hypothetical protein
MQDVQNIPNPDVNSTETNDDFGSHSDVEQELDQTDVENPNNDEGRSDIENPNNSIPVPPDSKPQSPVEEPPDSDDSPIREEQNEPKRIA